jgi:hypothetical protein
MLIRAFKNMKRRMGFRGMKRYKEKLKNNFYISGKY